MLTRPSAGLPRRTRTGSSCRDTDRLGGRSTQPTAATRSRRRAAPATVSSGSPSATPVAYRPAPAARVPHPEAVEPHAVVGTRTALTTSSISRSVVALLSAACDESSKRWPSTAWASALTSSAVA